MLNRRIFTTNSVPPSLCPQRVNFAKTRIFTTNAIRRPLSYKVRCKAQGAGRTKRTLGLRLYRENTRLAGSSPLEVGVGLPVWFLGRGLV